MTETPVTYRVEKTYLVEERYLVLRRYEILAMSPDDALALAKSSHGGCPEIETVEQLYRIVPGGESDPADIKSTE